MSNTGKGFSVVFIIIIGLLLQFVLVKAERIDTPGKAVAEFAEAYFKFAKRERPAQISKRSDNIFILPPRRRKRGVSESTI